MQKINILFIGLTQNSLLQHTRNLLFIHSTKNHLDMNQHYYFFCIILLAHSNSSKCCSS